MAYVVWYIVFLSLVACAFSSFTHVVNMIKTERLSHFGKAYILVMAVFIPVTFSFAVILKPEHFILFFRVKRHTELKMEFRHFQ